MMHYVGTSTREGLREMMQYYRRQHFAASNDLHEHPSGHSSWRDSTRVKFMNIQMRCSKMRSEPSEYMWKTRVMLTHLESNFGNYAQEGWERIRMDPDMRNVLHTKLVKAMLLNMYNPRLMKTVVKKFRERSQMKDRMKTAGEITDSVTRNIARLITNLERARRILGMAFRKVSAEDLVLIASLNRCKGSWHNQSPTLRKSQRRSVKQE